jgi:hypothetical protein
MHITTGAQSVEVVAYQRQILRLFNDAVPKSQSLTAKADYRSDEEKHEEGLTSWSRGNASDLPGRCPARISAQHLLHGQAASSVTLNKGRKYALKLHHYYSVPSAV